ncbi:transglycosylase SLT domain-containing protein [Serratia marcescens]|uniref:transglycosylase SLT domain-containing protein n=1 Tax=Serratia TaxID=613 RepID=UPI00074537FE|nr:transglycosylase SLT domain-containing protein [Serratia marcescens]NSM20160.1 transglycosylase SLT domain-containing protein [Serratia marcescens]NSM49063.1 transglycosylase SLT domain-containing protein [Serratia marcescens]CVC81967.1 membrane-bound lytic transglycosylase F [Serratia marcescens]
MRCLLSCLFLLLSACHPVAAAIPEDARQYQRELTRNARVVWGLDAPVATFAGQIHQESTWRATAKSPVGALGLAQFMPATAGWIAGIYPKSLGDNQPLNPAWAMRALVIYDRWHYDRITAASECDRWAYVLSAYNGGLGWVQRDRKLAASRRLDAGRYWNVVENVNAGRSAANFRENRGYPVRIIYAWQPLYERAGWGAGVCHDDE